MGQSGKYSIFKAFSLLAVVYSFIIACAQVGSPSGGPVDKTPPKIIKSFPENNSIEYKGNEIILVFDEFVQVKDLNAQLLISPPFEDMPEVKIKGKSVIVELKEPLKDSTTYTFNFGKAISDFTEGNPLDSNIFVFSTGTFLDSLSVSGNVKNITDGATEKDVFVMLYANLDDSIPYKEKPYYLTRTKEDGSFFIPNVRKGAYRIFALKDLNNNIIFDQPTEPVAFADSLLRLDSSTVVNLLLFEEAQEKQYIKKTDVPQYGKVRFIFNRPVDSLLVYPVNYIFEKDWYMVERSKNNDSITYWLTGLEEGLESLELLVKDFKELQDTVFIKIGKKEVAPKVENKLPGKSRLQSYLHLSASLNADLSAPLDPAENLELSLNHPIASFDLSNALLIQGEDSMKLDYMVKGFPIQRHFVINHEWLPDSTYSVFIPSGSFKDIFGIENDTISLSFKKVNPETLGSLAITLKLPEDKGHQFILQLCREKTDVLAEKILMQDEEVVFDHLKPGKYILKVIYDENNNGKWDTGKYIEKKQPEKIIYYTGDVTVRENWDLELEWVLEGAQEVEEEADINEEAQSGTEEKEVPAED